jgi:uncharacterized protein YcfJ
LPLLIPFDGHDVVGVAVGEVLGVLALGVHGVAGHNVSARSARVSSRGWKQVISLGLTGLDAHMILEARAYCSFRAHIRTTRSTRDYAKALSADPVSSRASWPRPESTSNCRNPSHQRCLQLGVAGQSAHDVAHASVEVPLP